MDLNNNQIKDTYGNLVTIGTTAGQPTTGTVQNGAGSDITDLKVNGNLEGNTLKGKTSLTTAPIAEAEWSSNFYNLQVTPSGQPDVNNKALWTATFNLDIDTVQVINSAQNNSCIRVNRDGWYKVEVGSHFFDLTNNLDMRVLLYEGAGATTINTLVCGLADKRFSEASADQLFYGETIKQFTADTYLDVFWVIQNYTTGNTPFPSTSDQTPSYFRVTKLA